jgi:hypothetical protein
LRSESLATRAADLGKLPWHATRETWSVLKALGTVYHKVRIRPVRGGLIRGDHPWATGIDPTTQKPIWQQNLLYASKRGRTFAKDDTQIQQLVGTYLAGMTKRSAATNEAPDGLPAFSDKGVRQRRMPHAINYLHGAVHYGAGWLLFDDFQDAIYHFTDPAFRDETRRFVREQKRELLIVFRDQHYDVKDYGRFVGFIRTALPWFSNGNGPKPVFPGRAAPYATVNVVTGHWIDDVNRLERDGEANIARAPIPVGRYFQQTEYRGTRTEARWPETILQGRAARLWSQKRHVKMRFLEERDDASAQE